MFQDSYCPREQEDCHLILSICCAVSSDKAMAPHSSTPAWKIPWMEEPGGLQSMGSLRVGHDWATQLTELMLCSFVIFKCFIFSLINTGLNNGTQLQYSCLENPRDEGAWWAAVYGVAQSRTRLKQLSSSSSSNYNVNWIFNMAHNVSNFIWFPLMK